MRFICIWFIIALNNGLVLHRCHSGSSYYLNQLWITNIMNTITSNDMQQRSQNVFFTKMLLRLFLVFWVALEFLEFWKFSEMLFPWQKNKKTQGILRAFCMAKIQVKNICKPLLSSMNKLNIQNMFNLSLFAGRSLKEVIIWYGNVLECGNDSGKCICWPPWEPWILVTVANELIKGSA